MAVYKVIQDIEAEDKLVGFLSLKAFIYALIAAALAYINVRFLLAGTLGPLRFVFVLIFIFPMLLFGVLAAPLGRDQPTEVWILSHVRFLIKKRRRVWDQSGAQELVTITAPKKIERNLTKSYSQNEVQSRLKALATTLDSRGWTVKNVAVNLNANPSYFDIESTDSDRLIGTSSIPQEQPVLDVHAADDIMDEQNNPTAGHFDALMQQADAKRKSQVRDKINVALQQKAEQKHVAGQQDTTFLDQVPAQMAKPGNTIFVGRKIIAPGSIEDGTVAPGSNNLGSEETSFLNKVHEKGRVVHAKSAGFKPKNAIPITPDKKSPVVPALQVQTTQKVDKPTVTAPPQDARLKKLEDLAHVARNDRISTLQQTAGSKEYQSKQIGPGETEIDFR